MGLEAVKVFTEGSLKEEWFEVVYGGDMEHEEILVQDSDGFMFTVNSEDVTQVYVDERHPSQEP